MQDIHTNIDRAPCRQPLWSPDEIARLRDFAEITAFQGNLLATFPGRTLPAIRIKLAMMRRDMGVAKKQEGQRVVEYEIMLDPADPGLASNYCRNWRRGAETSNRSFLAALQRAA